MSSEKLPCPIWEDSKFELSAGQYQRLQITGFSYDEPRAGGRFVLKQSGAALLESEELTDRRRANLSHWIYRHNHPSYLLFGASPDQGVEPPVLDEEWVKQHRDRTPSSSDRMLWFLYELMRSADAGEMRDNHHPLPSDLELAAGSCQDGSDWQELQRHAVEQRWLGVKEGNRIELPGLITHSARLYVEEQLSERGRDQRGENQQAVAPDPAKNESGFTISNIQDLPINEQVKPIVEERLDEIPKTLDVGAHLSVIFLCGSALEGVLLGAALQDPAKFNKAKATPKTKTENGSLKPKPFREWSLSDLIDVACEIEVLTLNVKKFGHVLRDLRNYIHPYEQMSADFTPDEDTAKICVQILEAALASLAGER